MVTWKSSIPNCSKIQSKGFLSSLDDQKLWSTSSQFGGVYLFVGPPGVDLLATAKHIAKLSICLGTRDPSCVCRHCVSGIASCKDVHLATLNQHGNLLSATVENVDRFFSTYPSSGSVRKILIVESVEKATATTSSSLLKVLEGGVRVPDIAIFTSSRPQLISLPLRSRMSEVLFSGVDSEESRTRYGSSQAGIDLALSQRWLSQPATDYYLQARKALPSILLGVQASDVQRSWKALQPCLASHDMARAAVEVLLLAITDMLVLCGGPDSPMPATTVLSSMKADASSYARTWGESNLVSLADDLRTILTGVVPGRDMRTVMYRWVLKSTSLASGKTFVKAEIFPTSSKAPYKEPIIVEDDIAIDFGETGHVCSEK